MDQNTMRWAVILHLSQFGGYFVPLLGFIAPILVWQLKKDEVPGLDAHGRQVANWLISLVIYLTVLPGLIFLCMTSFGIGMGFLGLFLIWLIAIGFGLLALIFPIIGAIKATNGMVWEYPLTIQIL